MFEHLRADLTNQLAQAHAATQQANTALDQGNAAVAAANTGLQSAAQALAQAQAAAAGAASAEAAARSDIPPLTHELDDASAELDQAQAALDALTGRGNGDGNGGKRKPPPRATPQQIAAARARVNAAQRKLDDADAALQDAQQQLQTATAQAASAGAARDAAQRQRDAAAAAFAARQQDVVGLTSARDRVQQAESAINAQLTGLDARVARILAQPLNRTDVQQAADAEVASLLALRARRHDLFIQRAAAVDQRNATLRGHDRVADQLGALAAALGSWSQTPMGSENPMPPEVGAVATGLEGIVNASRTQRQNAPQSRTDDLSAVQATLSGQLAQLTALAQQANADQATLAENLTRAARKLADFQAGG